MARTKHAQRKALANAKADANGEKKPRKPRRYRPGTVALRDIGHAQKTTNLSFQQAPFKRLVKEIKQELGKADFRITENAYLAMQTMAEDWLTAMFRESNRSARNAKRVKIKVDDFRLVYDLANHGLPELMREEFRFTFGGKTQSKTWIASEQKEQPVVPPVAPES